MVCNTQTQDFLRRNFYVHYTILSMYLRSIFLSREIEIIISEQKEINWPLRKFPQ